MGRRWDGTPSDPEKRNENGVEASNALTPFRFCRSPCPAPSLSAKSSFDGADWPVLVLPHCPARGRIGMTLPFTAAAAAFTLAISVANVPSANPA